MRISIRNIGLGIGVVLTLLVAYITIDSIIDRLKERTLAKRGLEITNALEIGYQALMPLSLERSVTQVGLTLETALPAQFAALRMEQRRISEGHFDALMGYLETTKELANKQETLNALRAARSTLTALRARADAAISVARKDRAGNSAELPQEIIAAIRGVQATLNGLADPAAMRAARAEQPTLAAFRIWRVREYAGQSRTFMAAAILNQQSMNLGTMKAASELNGRADDSFGALMTMRRSLPAELLTGIAAIETAYSRNFTNLRLSVMAEAETGKYPLDFSAFFVQSGEALGQIEGATNGFSAFATRGARAAVSDAEHGLLMTILIGLTSLIAVLFIAWLLYVRIALRLARTNQAMSTLANGNTSITINDMKSDDEIGDMARSLVVFRDNALRVAALEAEKQAAEEQRAAQRKAEMEKIAAEFEREIGAIVQSLNDNAREMTGAARAMQDSAGDVGDRSQSVLRSAEETSNIASGVAAATEEMTTSVGEISRQIQNSAAKTQEAVENAARTTDQINTLAETVGRIGSVVELINSIAGQTNLLALNATIEAARAGEAGKGFAVVASEVKALAAQTGKATAEISDQIAGIQSATGAAVTNIKDISGAISELEHIASTIASAIEEQNAVIADVANNVSRTSSLTEAVRGDASLVAKTAADSTASASQVLSTAQGLAGRSEDLSRAMAGFIQRVRAA